MKRSNRLVLLIGIFLAIVAFVLIVMLFRGDGGGGPAASAAPTTQTVVVAAVDIPLGATIQSTDLTTDEMAVTTVPADAVLDESLAIGEIARKDVLAGELIDGGVFASGGTVTDIRVPAGFVGMSVRVTQTSGVGTVVKPGDFVDIVTGFTSPENIKLVIPDLDATTNQTFVYAPYPADQYNETTVKAIAQGAQVLGTLLPPPPQAAEGQPAPSDGTTTLTEQEQIVIVAVPAQVAEVVKFAQLEGDISLVLRSSEDCTTDPVDGLTFCPTVATTGITLRRLVDDFGVLPPTVVQVLQPTPLPGTVPNNLGPGN